MAVFAASLYAAEAKALSRCLVRAVVNAEEGVGVSAALDLFNSLTGDHTLLLAPILQHSMAALQ